MIDERRRAWPRLSFNISREAATLTVMIALGFILWNYLDAFREFDLFTRACTPRLIGSYAAPYCSGYRDSFGITAMLINLLISLLCWFQLTHLLLHPQAAERGRFDTLLSVFLSAVYLVGSLWQMLHIVIMLHYLFPTTFQGGNALWLWWAFVMSLRIYGIALCVWIARRHGAGYVFLPFAGLSIGGEVIMATGVWPALANLQPMAQISLMLLLIGLVPIAVWWAWGPETKSEAGSE